MIPISWTWSPQIQFPFGSYTGLNQDIAPETSWFFGSIRAEAGIGSVEKEVFDVASYGRQLGLILDVLMPLIGEKETEKSNNSKNELIALYKRIEEVKSTRKNDLKKAALRILTKLGQIDKASFDEIISEVRRSAK